MKIVWSIPVRGERFESSRGDLVRARSLVEALRTEGHQVCVIEDSTRTGSTFVVSTYRRVVKRILPEKAALIFRDIGRWLHARAHGLRVASEARQYSADVIIETQVHFSGSGALASHVSGIPLVLDDCSPPSEETILGAGLIGLASRIFYKQARRASVLLVSSQALREQLIKEGVPSEKLCVFPNGVDVKAYSNKNREIIRKKFGLTHCFVMGFVGSFQPWHQVDLFVRALAEFKNDTSMHIILLGDGLRRKETLSLIQRLGLNNQVTALGAVPYPEVPELITAFDVGVLPGSNHYGNPMKLLEYAAAGIPSVAPDLLPVREVLEDGVTGLLFSPGDSAALAEKLRQLATDSALRKRLGVSARERFESSASWNARAHKLVSYITSR